MTAALLCLAMFAADPAQYFEKKVAPILARRCLSCHNNEMKDGGISFLDRDSVLKGGSHGPAIVPGKPEQSYLLRAISHKEDVKMPPGIPLPHKEVKTLTEWIRRGAVWGKIGAQ
ncbi:MAG: hypothetical protein IT165_23295 [Bryobacterales bacterium]|nr:hypothetical protein [Bryobacterales bacterium]